MLRSRFIAIAVALLSVGSALFADPRRDVRGDETVNYWSRYGAVEVLADRVLYRPGEEMELRFRVKNTGYRVIRIYPAEQPNKTFQFMLLNRGGDEIPMHFDAGAYEGREHGERQVVNLQGEAIKEIILHPGETFERRFVLNDFYRLSPGEEYRLVGYFFPDQRFEYFVRSKNTLHFEIDRAREATAGSRPDYTTQVDRVTRLTPEETIYLFLSAEMRQNWEDFMKYLDLRKYITAYDRFAGRYVQARERDRAEVLQEFARYLTSSPADRLRRFELTGSEPERGADGQILSDGRYFVDVRATRTGNGFTARYDYRFTLEPGTGRNEGYWQIVYVEARLLR